MRIYSASSMENLRARTLLKEWREDGLVSTEQYDLLEPQMVEEDTDSELRRTNIFLRVVLFLFTALCVGAAVGLFFLMFLERSHEPAQGIALLVFAGLAYAAAEATVREARFFRHGIEEALAAASVVLLCAGLEATLLEPGRHPMAFVVPAVGAVASLWIWRRFGLWYAFLAAMICAVFVAGDWALLDGGLAGFLTRQRVILAALYAVALIVVGVVRKRHRLDYLDGEYSLVEAMLWLGLYLAINLKAGDLANPAGLWNAGMRTGPEFPKLFYWTTWVLTWCLPPGVLVRGVRIRDRFVMGAGMLGCVLTFVTNKPYLGWARHTWDPMLLGVFLTGVALYLRRWLGSGVRHGFTAQRLSGKDSRWVHAGASVVGLITPHAMTPAAQTHPEEFKFGGGASGGGGAGGGF